MTPASSPPRNATRPNIVALTELAAVVRSGNSDVTEKQLGIGSAIGSHVADDATALPQAFVLRCAGAGVPDDMEQLNRA